jgi:CRP/FNR family transcriptional regulator, cyclic AMP receptor protein
MAYTTVVVPKQQPAMLSRGAANGSCALQTVKSAPVSPLIHHRVFRDLPPPVIKRLEAITSAVSYPRGAALFVEGQEPRGVFVISEGRVKLSANSPTGKTLILRVAGPGELIGLPGAISGQPYEATAEALNPLEAMFIPRADFLEWLREHNEAALRIAEILESILHSAYREVRHVGLSSSAAERLARFLLHLAQDQGRPNVDHEGQLGARLALTHEEIAHTIGLSRETVTRLLGDFKRKRLVEIDRGKVIISNQPELEKIIRG